MGTTQIRPDHSLLCQERDKNQATSRTLLFIDASVFLSQKTIAGVRHHFETASSVFRHTIPP